jgi:hypothetical protein
MMKVIGAILTSILILSASACGTSAPALPTDTSPAAVHDVLAGQDGQNFLYEITTHDWGDGGVHAAKLFEWIAAEATSPDPRVAARAGESAQALASFLSNRGEDLLDIKTGVFGLTRSTVGALNPSLIRAYGAALTPFQGAMVCDTRSVEGFGALANPCEEAVSAAKPVFAALNTDPATASAFADAASARMDRYIQLFAENDPASVSNPFPSALPYVGRLLGLVTIAASHSDVTPPTLQAEVNKVSYVLVKAMLTQGHGTFPPEFLVDGRLMSPAEVQAKLGINRLDEYYFGLNNYLMSMGVQQLIKDQLRGQYEFVTGHQ